MMRFILNAILSSERVWPWRGPNARAKLTQYEPIAAFLPTFYSARLGSPKAPFPMVRAPLGKIFAVILPQMRYELWRYHQIWTSFAV